MKIWNRSVLNDPQIKTAHSKHRDQAIKIIKFTKLPLNIIYFYIGHTKFTELPLKIIYCAQFASSNNKIFQEDGKKIFF